MSAPLPNNVSMARLTGRVVGTDEVVKIDVPRKRKRRKGWRDHVSMVDVGMMSRLELTGGESRVLFCLMAHVPEKGGSESIATAEEIASELEVSRQYVATILRSLRERQVIFTRRRGRHRINTWLCYNGDFDSWNAEADDDPEPVWSRAVNPTTGEVK